MKFRKNSVLAVVLAAAMSLGIVFGLAGCADEKAAAVSYGEECYEKLEYIDKMFEDEIEKIGKIKYQLIELFKEMLAFKKKEYNEKWTFEEWLDMIDTNYHFYHEEILKINLNEKQEIDNLIRLYEILKEEGNDYTKYAYYYRDYILENGQTYEKLYQGLKQKFILLFKEMLNEVKEMYDQNICDFDDLKVKVIDQYPFYFDTLMHLDVMISNKDTTYIELLNSMENIYDKISKSYKNREELLKKYKEEQEIEWID